jgi:ribonuclease Z
MFEVTVLGCSAAMPTKDRNLSSIAVRRDGDVLLLDCGEGTQRQMLRFGVSAMKAKAVFITHLHLDHFLGVFGLAETLKIAGKEGKLKVFVPKGGAPLFSGRELLDVVEYGEGRIADFGEYFASAFMVKHGRNSFGIALEEKGKIRFYEEKAKGLGLKGPMFTEIQQKGKLTVNGKVVKLKDVTYLQAGKKLVYTGDTAPCAAVARAAKGADLLIHESTFGQDRLEEAKEAGHSTALDAALAAKKAGAKRLLLTHISSRYADARPLLEEAKKEFAATEIAYDGYRAAI